MPEDVGFRTKPQLARGMLERAVESGVPFSWVVGDEVYGSDRNLRLWLEGEGLSHLLAIKSNEQLWVLTDKGPGQVRADRLVSGVDESGWVRCSAGDGAKDLRGPRGLRLGLGGYTASAGAGQRVLALGPAQHSQTHRVGLLPMLRPSGNNPGGTGAGGRNPVGYSGGLLRNALRRPRGRWGWTSATVRRWDGGTVGRWDGGTAGTGTSPWRCWPTPIWRWYGTRHRGRAVWEKRGLPQFGRKADTADGARGSAVLYRLIWRHHPTNESVLRWSQWRRRHQATARSCHYRRRLKLLTTYLQL